MHRQHGKIDAANDSFFISRGDNVLFSMFVSSRNGLEIQHNRGKRVKTKSQIVFGANSNVCRGCRGKNGRGAFWNPEQS